MHSVRKYNTAAGKPFAGGSSFAFAPFRRERFGVLHSPGVAVGFISEYFGALRSPEVAVGSHGERFGVLRSREAAVAHTFPLRLSFSAKVASNPPAPEGPTTSIHLPPEPEMTYGAKPIRHRASSGAHNLDATLANCSGSPPGLSSAAPLLLPFPEPLLRPATQSSPNPKNTFNPKNIAFRAKNVGFRVFRFFSGFFVYMFAARFHSEYSFLRRQKYE